MYLNCPKVNGTDTVISKIQFASYGTPTGVCGNFQLGRYDSARVAAMVASVLSLLQLQPGFHRGHHRGPVRRLQQLPLPHQRHLRSGPLQQRYLQMACRAGHLHCCQQHYQLELHFD
jgi:hypothetical protein